LAALGTAVTPDDGDALAGETGRSGNLLETVARHSRWARRGLGTQRALYYRIAPHARIALALEASRQYLGKPTKRLTRLSEAPN